MSYATRALAAASVLLIGAPMAALAHTNSIGYVGDGNGGVTFWYGNWHPGTTFNEGNLTLVGINGNSFPSTTVNWTLLSGTQPTGLIPGTNYFTSNGSALVAYPANPISYTWQGVTFSGLSAGDYRFTYNAAGSPTVNWMPMDSIILSSTVTITAAALSGDADGDGINDATGQPIAPATPTLVSSAAGAPIVTTSTSSGTRTTTSTQDRYVFDTQADSRSYYVDTVTTTIPTTTTVTSSTATTVDTYSDGSTVTNNGATTTTTSTADAGAGTSVVTQATVPVWVETRTYDVQRSAYSPSAAPTLVHTPTYKATESNGKQNLNLHVKTGVTTPTVRTVTTTAVYTKVYTNGSPNTVTNDPSVITYETSSTYDEYHTYRDWYGRVDQLEVLEGISGAMNGMLDHEPITNHKKRFRVFENNRFAQSYNADGYTAKSTAFGGGFEYDLTKGWTAGAQYNDLYTEMLGVDSISHMKRQHVGIFNSFHGRDVALVTNAGGSLDKYDYARTLEYTFANWGKVDGQQWWVHNRLYLNNSGWIKPFLGHTVSNVKRNGYAETGSPESARIVEAYDKTTHVGEAGIKLETRFGGKKHDAIGISIDGAYGTDNSYSVTGSVDYKEVLYVEGSHGVADGLTTNSVSAKVKFRF